MKNVKKFLAILLEIAIIFTFVACSVGGNGGNNGNSGNSGNQSENGDNSDGSSSSEVTPPEKNENGEDLPKESKTLVVYFSRTGTTENVAKIIQKELGADIFVVERKEPYPDSYTPTTEEAKREKEAGARPELKEYLPKETVAECDKIFVGFPIWWGTAPMPILTFLENYDLTGKTVYTFCTAASSPISGSTADIRSSAAGATVIEGKRFSRNDESGIKTWLSSLD